MYGIEHITTIKLVFRFFKRKASIIMIAFMLGMSNVILEEDRMVNDTRQHIEQPEMVADDDFNDAVYYKDAL